MTATPVLRQGLAALLIAVAGTLFGTWGSQGALAQVVPAAAALPAMPGARPFTPPVEVSTTGLQWPSLLERAEAALEAGDTQTALDALQQAAAQRHSPDIETGLVRAQMQAGEYRRALAFAAHTAGAHPFDGNGIALYGWLLYVGGQPVLAHQLLGAAAQRLPGDPAVAATLERTQAVAPPSVGSAPPRFRFPLRGPTPGSDARWVGSATSVGDGQLALVPLAWLEGAQTIWLRDCTGGTYPAELVKREPQIGLALLRLMGVEAGVKSVPAARREAFAGSPAFAFGHVAPAAGMPPWPVMTLGFLAMPRAVQGARPLGFDLSSSSPGGPVFDSSGRWIGVTLPNADGTASLVSAAAARALWEPGEAAGAAPERVTPRIAVDELYEAASRLTLQVIVATRDATLAQQGRLPSLRSED